MKYLAIKNWRKYQTIDDEKGRAPFIKDFVDKDEDPDRTKLSVFEGGVLDRLYRLRARYGRILNNDITWVTQATHVPPRDRARIPHTIHTLTERNFIIPTDDENFEASAAVEVRKGKVRQGRDKVHASGVNIKSEEKPTPSPADCFIGGPTCDPLPVPPNIVCDACMAKHGCDGQGVIHGEGAAA